MRRMMNRLLRRAIGAFIFLATSGLVWAACGGTEAIVVQSAAELTEAVIQKLSEMTKDVMKADYDETSSVLEAIKVVTKQVRVSGEYVSAMTVQASKARSGAQLKVLNRELADEVYVDYQSMGAQDPCGTVSNTTRLYEAENVSRGAVPARLRSEVDVGKYADTAGVLQTRESLHRDYFCTQSDVDAGLCSKLGKLPGGDQNAALLWSSDASTEASKARSAFINNLVGVPDAPVPVEVAGTPEASAYMLEKRRRDSFKGIAAYSLKSIQVENETLRPVLDARVGDYFGTSRATQWAKNQATQAPRGLLIDGVKIQGLNLKIAQLRLEQQWRTEMVLAALSEQENQLNNKADVVAAQNAMMVEAARIKVSK